MWVSIGMGTGNALVRGRSSDPGDPRKRPAQSAPAPLGDGNSWIWREAAACRHTVAGHRIDGSRRDTVTAIDPFDANRNNPYLSFYLRQPIHCRGILPNGMEALIDVSNLLAEGYRPFVTSDGSVLYFAQASRAVEGGLSFSF